LLFADAGLRRERLASFTVRAASSSASVVRMPNDFSFEAE
jgi:hypothetical protein